MEKKSHFFFTFFKDSEFNRPSWRFKCEIYQGGKKVSKNWEGGKLSNHNKDTS